MFWLGYASAYLEESIDTSQISLAVSDQCSITGNTTHTTLRLHDMSLIKDIPHASTIVAVNNKCDIVLLGFPDLNQVLLWRPFESTIHTVNSPVTNPVYRFGFSIDIYENTWVVGAPGHKVDEYGHGSTLGYAFIFEGDTYHSCHSQYDSYCFLEEDSCTSGFQAWKNVHNLRDADVKEFQKQCPPELTPNYETGPAKDFEVARFHKQQFGYDVSITDTLLYVSAPGDTKRFLEDNDGSNFGRVFMFYVGASITNITWRTPSIKSPLAPPPIDGGQYRAYGRSIASTPTQLIVSSYPLYNRQRDVFVFLYLCERNICVQSPRDGIRTVYLRDHTNSIFDALRVHTSTAAKAYSDKYSGRSYIASDLDVSLGDVQNDMTGAHVGLVGSNILISDKKNKYVYRFGTDTEFRETHIFENHVSFGSSSEHWSHSTSTSLTHLWPCIRGYTGLKEYCSFTDSTCPFEKCSPCPIGTFSNDGWLETCDWCPPNSTTYQEASTKCSPWLRPIIQGISWEETSNIMYILAFVAAASFICLCLCQRCCFASGRRNRTFIQ